MAWIPEHIASLVTGYNNSTLTEPEQKELDEWIVAADQNRLLFEELSNPEILRTYLQQMEGFNEARIWQKLIERLPLPAAPVRRLFAFKKIAVAASVLLVAGLGTYFIFLNRSEKSTGIVNTIVPQDVKAPETNRAMITLANGQKVFLDSAMNGSLAKQGGVDVVKLADGKIVYEGTSTSLSVTYNTLTNPRGSKVIDMTLADGSRVWLNAGSSVTYPVAFVGTERKVEITGEAYFEIAHLIPTSPQPSPRVEREKSTSGERGKWPFIVEKGDMQVKVLGTHFNVNAYDDESDIKVTLLEGSVRVRSEVGGQKSEVIIKPGEQAKVLKDGEIASLRSQQVDVEQVMAWKNGIFAFAQSDLQAVMRQIARWYDVEVEYEGKVPERKFGGEISRMNNVSEVLKVLEESQVRFRIDGRRIVVMP